MRPIDDIVRREFANAAAHVRAQNAMGIDTEELQGAGQGVRWLVVTAPLRTRVENALATGVRLGWCGPAARSTCPDRVGDTPSSVAAGRPVPAAAQGFARLCR